MKPFALASCLTLCSIANLAQAQSEPIATDRPDFVESSLTVGDRRLQVETSVAWERDEGLDGYSTPTLFRYGIGPDWELRLETDGWQTVDAPAGGRDSGFSDVSLGVKRHLTSEVGGATLAWLLHVDLPSGAHSVRGRGARPSLRLVAEWELSDSVSAGVMPGLIHDADEDGHHYTAGIFGAVLGKAWSERSRSFVEVALPQIAHHDDGGTLAQLNVGSAWLLNQDVQVDVVYSHGLNDRSPDHAVGAGLSFRF
ncbi:transporter [Pseudoxanthomonas sp. JBR18]|uniref:transporter n=1 Tax=Pseudoxanthomonas sp. JBR18 TaxID=2969308 RepID=UPI00230554BF|nr:transporter [Pseudoxanthomonas sp. JBR18]WCE03702.1 transporter [Pseudoxanthomonas sp. JBR18]